MERDLITQQECYYCCQTLLDQDVNVCLSSFKSNLDYAKDRFEEEEDEDDEENMETQAQD